MKPPNNLTESTKAAARCYTLAEIDRMRSALHGIRPYTHNYWSGGFSFSGSSRDYHAAEEARWASHRSSIEEELRTCMIGGVGPVELEAKAAEATRKREEQQVARDAEIYEARLRQEYGPRE